MRDFTISIYRRLLEILISSDFGFQTFGDFIELPGEKSIILRHDVDRNPMNSLAFAKIQAGMGIRGTYFFRIVPQSFNEKIILEIASSGHEIGYHYEDLAMAKGNPERAIQMFADHLERFRKLIPVKTICMHGSPLSAFDNRLLWKKYNYRDFGIIAEPYFDLDFSKTLYLTDTGRRWDGSSVSVRDKMKSPLLILQKLHSTNDIIQAVRDHKFTEKIMFTFHPQRWNDRYIPWVKELIFQNAKNLIKHTIVTRQDS